MYINKKNSFKKNYILWSTLAVQGRMRSMGCGLDMPELDEETVQMRGFCFNLHVQGKNSKMDCLVFGI